MPVDKVTRQLKLGLTDPLWEVIAELAAQEDRSMSEWIRHRLNIVCFGEAIVLDPTIAQPSVSRDVEGPRAVGRRRVTAESWDKSA